MEIPLEVLADHAFGFMQVPELLCASGVNSGWNSASSESGAWQNLWQHNGSPFFPAYAASGERECAQRKESLRLLFTALGFGVAFRRATNDEIDCAIDGAQSSHQAPSSTEIVPVLLPPSVPPPVVLNEGGGPLAPLSEPLPPQANGADESTPPAQAPAPAALTAVPSLPGVLLPPDSFLVHSQSLGILTASVRCIMQERAGQQPSERPGPSSSGSEAMSGEPMKARVVLQGCSGVGKSVLTDMLQCDARGDISAWMDTQRRSRSDVRKRFAVLKPASGSAETLIEMIEIAGSARPGPFSGSLFRGSCCVLLVFHVCQRESFTFVERMLQEESQRRHHSIPRILVGCTWLLSDELDAARAVSHGDAAQLAARHACPYIEINSGDTPGVAESVRNAFALAAHSALAKPMPESKRSEVRELRAVAELMHEVNRKQSWN